MSQNEQYGPDNIFAQIAKVMAIECKRQIINQNDLLFSEAAICFYKAKRRADVFELCAKLSEPLNKQKDN